MKTIHIIIKVLLSIMLMMPLFGVLGLSPELTPEMYNTETAYTFIKILMESQYVMIMLSVVFLISLFSLWTKRTALAALLLLPISLNIIGFHAFLDGGIFTTGALMGNVFFLINIYLLWISCNQIKPLTEQRG